MMNTDDDITEAVSDEQWQDDSQWSKRATLHASRTDRTAAQVVTFDQDELNAIREAAERAGVRTSEYIRRPRPKRSSARAGSLRTGLTQA